jgi:hypothetical protein
VRAQIERDVPVGFNFHKEVLAPKGSREALGLENRLVKLEGRFPKLRILDEMGRFDEKRMWRQLGSLGGGNHFVEICLDAEGAVWIMLHSGSRNVGKTIGESAMYMAKKVAERVDRRLPHRDPRVARRGNAGVRGVRGGSRLGAGVRVAQPRPDAAPRPQGARQIVGPRGKARR